MPKLAKNMYKSLKTGEKKLNCYLIHLSKEVVAKANIQGDDEVKIYAEGNRIIIGKSK